MIEQLDFFDEESPAVELGQPGSARAVGPEPGASTTPVSEAEPVEESAAEAEVRGQLRLLEVDEDWRREWRAMPAFEQEDRGPYKTIYVHFETPEAVEAFARLVGQRVRSSGGTRYADSIWYPEAEIGRYADKRWRGDPAVGPRYPVYVVSKGRAESRLTVKALEAMAVPYRIVVEPQEAEAYAVVIDPVKILVLPFGELGEGSIPARNWIWEYALAGGAARHWILDDNIKGFYRLNRNLKVPVSTGAIFRAAEDFVERYENVALAGFQYFMFASRKTRMPAFVLNTRIYSTILVRNDLAERWRGRYNEDTDLSLRVLKAGWVTVLFNAFLAEKTTTLSMPGGNTDELYAGDGRQRMAESLVGQHPDVAGITWKWGRWQHQVDYSAFRYRNRLLSRPGVAPAADPDEYGMSLVHSSELSP